jgi:hypothetical protein
VRFNKYKKQIVCRPAATEPRRGRGMIDLIGNVAIVLNGWDCPILWSGTSTFWRSWSPFVNLVPYNHNLVYLAPAGPILSTWSHNQSQFCHPGISWFHFIDLVTSHHTFVNPIIILSPWHQLVQFCRLGHKTNHNFVTKSHTSQHISGRERCTERADTPTEIQSDLN